jgi:hypothetical protein
MPARGIAFAGAAPANAVMAARAIRASFFMEILLLSSGFNPATLSLNIA